MMSCVRRSVSCGLGALLQAASMATCRDGEGQVLDVHVANVSFSA